jgi:hypothetical protein
MDLLPSNVLWLKWEHGFNANPKVVFLRFVPFQKFRFSSAFFVANTFQIQPFHKYWRSRQMWLFVLCQEHSTDINYQCWLHWHPSHVFATLDKLSHGSVIILGFLPTISR